MTVVELLSRIRLIDHLKHAKDVREHEQRNLLMRDFLQALADNTFVTTLSLQDVATLVLSDSPAIEDHIAPSQALN